jgi:hypothetical protein
VFFIPVIISVLFFVAGSYGLRLKPSPQRALRQVLVTLRNLGFIMMVCCAAGWFVFAYSLYKMPGIVH